MKRLTLILLVIATMTACKQDDSKKMISRSDIQLENDVLTPEALWAMGRIGAYSTSPDGGKVAYQVTYYSVKENRSNSVIYIQNISAQEKKKGQKAKAASKTSAAAPALTGLGSSPSWIDNDNIAFLLKGDIWTMNADGKKRRQLTHTEGAVNDFLFSPSGKHVILIKTVPYHDIIKERPADLPKSTGLVITDLMYRHWDHYVESIPHPFVLNLESGEEYDILEGLPYECPMEPFGGVEQIAWQNADGDDDSNLIAFTCRVRTGLAYSISTDSDIFLYDVNSHDVKSARNLCKSGSSFGDAVTAASAYLQSVDPSKALRNQPVNSGDNLVNNPGYDQNPKFSPDGRYVAWLSMQRDGYEADRQRLCVCDIQTGEKRYVTEVFDSNVDDFVWADDNKTIYFIGVWHATENLYSTNLEGEVKQLTNDQADWGSLKFVSQNRGEENGAEKTLLLMERHDFFHPSDLYLVNISSSEVSVADSPSSAENEENTSSTITLVDSALVDITRLTAENDHILSQLSPGSSEPRWCQTTDNQKLLYWVIKPPHFDPSKKYPTLLFCEGGPQSPVSQFWSYRWNFYIMAAQGYVIIAPNRRGLPGFGQDWLEEISGDWTGQCMNDYLSAIDDACDSLPFVDRDRLGAVGASFGGFSVYYLAGHHDKRFKCFISHDGAFNLEAMYTETEENWFSNWEYDDAYWNQDRTANADRTYKNSPHLSVDKWDTPILCIHGEKDYRINATQGMSAFNAARMRGIEAELLLYPDENHWVLKPQNGILWQRTFFDWLSRWLK
ncbi:MAG: S9 family peptidase [Bacteroidaceae bacterium]|nr:S9 family peptidase [Bacteroidaceae bacterium]